MLIKIVFSKSENCVSDGVVSFFVVVGLDHCNPSCACVFSTRIALSVFLPPMSSIF
jgi:hypothetical protein